MSSYRGSRTREIAANYLNGIQFGRSYGGVASTPTSPFVSSSSVKPQISAGSRLFNSGGYDRNRVSGTSSVDTDFTSPFSSFSSGRYSNSTLSSRESGSVARLENSFKTNPEIRPETSSKQLNRSSPDISDEYVIVISRACSTTADSNFRAHLVGVSATKTEKMRRSSSRAITFTNGTQTTDDIILPATKTSPGSPGPNKVNTPRRLNIGGRYLSQLQRQDSTEPQSPSTGRSWRESVYGVDYLAKSRSQTQPPTSPQPNQTMSLVEQKRLERDRMLEEEWKNQIQLEIDREKRRLRQLERKARWEKDELKNKELEEEIKRRKKIAAELSEKEASLRNADEMKRKELLKQQTIIPDEINTPQDPIQKVNDWKRQNSFQNADPPSAGEMSSSQLWDVDDRVNDAQQRENAVKRRPHINKPEVSRYSRDSEVTIRQDTLTSDNRNHTPNLSHQGDRRRSSMMSQGSGSYATKHTDIDDFLKAKFPEKSMVKQTKVNGLSKSPSLRRDYYADGSGDSDEEDVKLVYRSWKSKELFQRMSTEVQNLLMKSHKQPVNVRMLMDVCRNKNHERRFTDAEEKSFRGYKTGNELLIESGVDVKKLEDSALQICRFAQAQAEFGAYLDLDSSLQEQWEELEISSDQENSIILRTKLVVRVKAIIEKLLNSTGRELRRALFSLKQIFQDDKDLVHEFVTNAGLDCLVSVGLRSDQNLQNYILRALGQIMLYVDGMAGVIEHPDTLRWLYSLLASKFRLVTKTALKLLLVFVEYIETNALVFIQAVHTHHATSPSSGKPWSYLFSILSNEASGTELAIYAMNLLNKTLNAVPDQDTFYDVTDSLEEMGMQEVVRTYMNKKNADPELLEQFQLYEASLAHEDGEDYDFSNLPPTARDLLRQTKRMARSQFLETPEGLSLLSSLTALPTSAAAAIEMDRSMKRRSRRPHVADSSDPLKASMIAKAKRMVSADDSTNADDTHPNDAVRGKSITVPEGPTAGSVRNKVEALGKSSPRTEATPVNGTSPSQSGTVKSLAERHSSIIDKPEESPKSTAPRERTGAILSAKERFESGLVTKPPSVPQAAANNRKLATEPTPVTPAVDVESSVDYFWERCIERVKRRPLHLKEFDFTDLEAEGPAADAVDSRFSGKTATQISSAHSPGVPPPPPPGIPPPPPGKAVPPPPPPGGGVPPPPPMSGGPPPPPGSTGSTTGPQLNLPPAPGSDLVKSKKTIKVHWTEWKPSQKDLKLIAEAKQNKVEKLEPISPGRGVASRFCSQIASRYKEPKERPKDLKKSTIWSELVPVKLDADYLQDCFENRVAEVKVKKQDTGMKKIEVLDPKRSNAINIGMKVLPPPRAISTAILKMDPSIINREGIEKLLTSMLPTEEECEAILKAKAEQDGLPLGQAEQFLITLSEITHLKPRLELWLFKQDYESNEKEVGDALYDLKQGISEVVNCRTLRYVLSTMLAVGNFLNGTTYRGFTLDYLSRLPEVKDTKSKNSMLHHICCLVLDQFPDSSDIHSELGALCRCHRVDWTALLQKLDKLEADSKQAWEHYRLIFNTEKEKQKNAKLYEYITDAMERIVCLHLVYQRLMVRFRHMLEYVGYSPGRASSMTVDHFCRIMAEFALEYRTTREKIIESRAKKAKARDRKRTTGKLIIDVTGLRGTPNKAQVQDDEALRGILSQPNGETDSDVSSLMGTLNRRRGTTPARRLGFRGKSPSVAPDSSDISTDGAFSEQDALLDACLRASNDSLSGASPAPRRSAPRERRRPAAGSRISIRRTITRKLAEEEVRALERFVKTATEPAAL